MKDLKKLLVNNYDWRKLVKFITSLMFCCVVMCVQAQGYYSLFIVQHVLTGTAHVLFLLMFEKSTFQISPFARRVHLLYGILNIVAGILVATNIQLRSPKRSYVDACYDYVKKSLSMEVHTPANFDFIVITSMTFVQGMHFIFEAYVPTD